MSMRIEGGHPEAPNFMADFNPDDIKRAVPVEAKPEALDQTERDLLKTASFKRFILDLKHLLSNDRTEVEINNITYDTAGLIRYTELLRELAKNPPADARHQEGQYQESDGSGEIDFSTFAQGRTLGGLEITNPELIAFLGDCMEFDE